ncbi:MAG: hypothetical protein NVS9B1_27260 [Candidatus Dormibacteraceae bacterium]
MTTDSGSHFHGTTAIDAAIADLQARVTKLETPVLTVSPPITVSANNVTISDKSISGTQSNGPQGTRIFGIQALGTAANPITNLVIRRCVLSGMTMGIYLRYVKDLVIEDCTITDADYAGILVYSGVSTTVGSSIIRRNTIQRIGYARTDFSDPAFQNNAYGIALSRNPTTDYTTDPRSAGYLVSANLIEDVPLWHGLDTHAGQDITFSGNTMRRIPRPIFITTDASPSDRPINITLTNNRMEQALSKTGGTNKTAITLVNLQGGTISGNLADAAYGSPLVYDYVGSPYTGSTWTDGGGNGWL